MDFDLGMEPKRKPLSEEYRIYRLAYVENIVWAVVMGAIVILVPGWWKAMGILPLLALNRVSWSKTG